MPIPIFHVLLSALTGIIIGALPDILSRFGLRPKPIISLIIDIAKGLAACFAVYYFGSGGFGMAVAGALVVFSSNFSPFSPKTKSGISVALGVAMAINPLPAILWSVMWLTGYGVIRHERIVGNLTGTFGTMALIWTTPDLLLRLTTFPQDLSPIQITSLTLIICFQIFLRLIPEARKYFQSMKDQEEAA